MLSFESRFASSKFDVSRYLGHCIYDTISSLNFIWAEDEKHAKADCNDNIGRLISLSPRCALVRLVIKEAKKKVFERFFR